MKSRMKSPLCQSCWRCSHSTARSSPPTRSTASAPSPRRWSQQGGDYVLALKGNQGTLHDDVQLFLDDPAHASELSVSDARLMATMAGSRRARPSSAQRSTGCRTSTIGRGWPRSARSRARARSTARPAARPRIFYSVRRCPRRGSARSSAPIGASRTACTGCWT